MKQVGFFKALYGTCCGTAIFFDLRYNRMWRVFWHLFLLSFFCAVAISFMQFKQIEPRIRTVADGFFATFGGICATEKMIIPLSNPGQPRNFDFLLNEGKIYYMPFAAEGVNIPDRELQLLKIGVIWLPQKVFYFAREPKSDFWQVGSSALDSRRYSTAELKQYLADLKTDNVPKAADNVAILTHEEGLKILSIFLAAFLLAGNFIMLFGVAIFYTVVFATIFRLTGGSRMQSLTFVGFWKVGIYAGFPAMIFAGFFPALELPFFSYSTIYMIGLMVYWLIVANRIERANVGS
ncbi:MAG: DUF1189 domain-containing protein [Victivallales bacterium]|jgi:hypothetical protein|nr:DUF1189 domain-containing protein [Victivallales bacterium]